MSEQFNPKEVATEFHSLNALPIVPPTTPALVVLQQMQYTQASCVLIVENQKLLGIFTERDAVRTIATRLNLQGLPISALMSSQVITLRESEAKDLSTVLQRFRRYRIRHLPIVNDAGLLVGVATPESVRQTLHPSDLLRMRRVHEVMESRVVCSAPTTSIEEIAQMMATRQVSCIVITDADASPASAVQFPIGILTERDIVQLLASGLDLAQTPAHQVMSSPLIPVCPSETLWHANQQMQYSHVRRLVVMGTAGELKGIITQTDILQALDPIELAEAIQSLQQLIEQKDQALQHELNYRKRVEADLEKISQTIEKTIQRSVSRQTKYLENHIKGLHDRNQKLEQDLHYYISREASLERNLGNRYFHGVVYELNTSLHHIKMAIQMLEIILKQTGAFGKVILLIEPYFQILENECGNSMQIVQGLSKPNNETHKNNTNGNI